MLESKLKNEPFIRVYPDTLSGNMLNKILAQLEPVGSQNGSGIKYRSQLRTNKLMVQGSFRRENIRKVTPGDEPPEGLVTRDPDHFIMWAILRHLLLKGETMETTVLASLVAWQYSNPTNEKVNIVGGDWHMDGSRDNTPEKSAVVFCGSDSLEKGGLELKHYTTPTSRFPPQSDDSDESTVKSILFESGKVTVFDNKELRHRVEPMVLGPGGYRKSLVVFFGYAREDIEFSPKQNPKIDVTKPPNVWTFSPGNSPHR